MLSNAIDLDDVLRNPYSLKIWLRYLEYSQSQTIADRFNVYSTALSYLPRSYKLWRAYLLERVKHLGKYAKNDDSNLIEVIDLFEKALRRLNKMPRIWYFV